MEQSFDEAREALRAAAGTLHDSAVR